MATRGKQPTSLGVPVADRRRTRSFTFEIYVANGSGLISRSPTEFSEFAPETRLTEVISALVEPSTNILNFTIVSVPEHFTRVDIETIMSNPPLYNKVKLSRNQARQEEKDRHLGYASEGMQILSKIVLNRPIPESLPIKDVLKYKSERYDDTAAFNEPTRKLVAIPTRFVFKVYDAKTADFTEKEDMYVQIGLGTTVEDVFFQIFPEDKDKEHPTHSLNRIYLRKENPTEGERPRIIGRLLSNDEIMLSHEFLDECLSVTYIVGIQTSEGLDTAAVERFRLFNSNQDEPETDIIEKLKGQGAIAVLPVFRDTLSASKQLRLLLPFWPLYTEFLTKKKEQITRKAFIHFALKIWHYWDFEYISNALDPPGKSSSTGVDNFEVAQETWTEKRYQEGGRIKQIFNFYEDPDFPQTKTLFKKFLTDGERDRTFVADDPLFGEQNSPAQNMFMSKVTNMFRGFKNEGGRGGKTRRKKLKLKKSLKRNRTNRRHRRHK